MALVAGPNVSWVCRISCDQLPVSRDCQHEKPAATLIAEAMDYSCDSVTPGVVGFVPGDVRHTGTLVDHSNPAQGFPSGHSVTGGGLPAGHPPEWSTASLSLATALRL